MRRFFRSKRFWWIGGILTVLAFSHCTHKESYRDIFFSLTLIPAVGSILIAVIWGLLL